ncbi:hypothetical protein CEXT_723961 [Caerostris extrusa]|uniref:Uncharacterized protein n=1 Tax=Caerostris extrusa TaxID=172846 RepID=A0AAV4XF06_CAEEX|nr:hypothetical protein CEXT_723961 [Caerostris extrusa]
MRCKNSLCRQIAVKSEFGEHPFLGKGRLYGRCWAASSLNPDGRFSARKHKTCSACKYFYSLLAFVMSFRLHRSPSLTFKMRSPSRLKHSFRQKYLFE